jgi:hypothetical protein
VSGAGAGALGCGTGASTITANPSSVDLISCSSSPSVVLSGGSGSYTAAPNDSRIEAIASGTNVLTIRRKALTPAMPQGTYAVTVADANANTASIAVRVVAGADVACRERQQAFAAVQHAPRASGKRLLRQFESCALITRYNPLILKISETMHPAGHG